MPILYNQTTVGEILKTDGKSVKQYTGKLHGKIMHKMLPFDVNGKAQTLTIGIALTKQKQGLTVKASKLLPVGEKIIKDTVISEEEKVRAAKEAQDKIDEENAKKAEDLRIEEEAKLKLENEKKEAEEAAKKSEQEKDVKPKVGGAK